MKKTCNKCKHELEETKFSKNKSTKDGLQYQCKSCSKKMQRLWRKNNPEKSKKSIKTWADNNKSRRNEYARKRRKNNIHCLLLNRLRRRLSGLLQGDAKENNAMGLLGCSLDKFRLHIESQFTDGMSWDCLGMHGIHIDHIRPCASFDLSDPEQQRQCFHYTNLQPLWAKDNLEKSAKISHH